MKEIASLFRELRDRWRAKTPAIFSGIIKVSIGCSTIAMAIQTALVTAGAEVPEWWASMFPYFVGAGAGMAAVAKLTQQYDRHGNPIRKRKRNK